MKASIFTLVLSLLLFACKDEKGGGNFRFTEIPEADAHRMIDQFYDSLSQDQQKATRQMSFNRDAIVELLRMHKEADTFAICFAAFDKVYAKKYADQHKVPYDSVYNKPTVLFALPKAGAEDERAYYMEATICPPPRSCERY